MECSCVPPGLTILVTVVLWLLESSEVMGCDPNYNSIIFPGSTLISTCIVLSEVGGGGGGGGGTLLI